MFDEDPNLPGWIEDETSTGSRAWLDAAGDSLRLTSGHQLFAIPDQSDLIGLQHWARGVVESRNAGLIEVRIAGEGPQRALSFVLKQRGDGLEYVYTGVLMLEGPEGQQEWRVTAEERGTTGVRDAFATQALVEAGQVTLENYEQVWAQDPYDPGYDGVERHLLRFQSDDEGFDAQFPDHPLSKVRRVLRHLTPGESIEARRDMKAQMVDAMVVEAINHNISPEAIQEVLVERGYDPELVAATVACVSNRRWLGGPDGGPSRRKRTWRDWLRGERANALVVGGIFCAGGGIALAFGANLVGAVLLVLGVKSLFGGSEYRR